jgi:restriction system protein
MRCGNPKRGRFAITPPGQQVLANPPARLDTKFLLTIPAFRDFYRGGDDSEAVTVAAEVEPPSATPEGVVEAAYKAVHAALRADLLDRILQNSPSFFEQVIVELLVAMLPHFSKRIRLVRLIPMSLQVSSARR